MREIDRIPASIGRQVRPPSRVTSSFGSVGQRPPSARQARVAELTASSRLTGADLVLGEAVLDDGDAVLEVVGSGLSVGSGLFVVAGVGDGRVGLGEGGRVAEGSTAETGSAASECDLSSMASKVIKKLLTKTNPPMATFGQWPFRLSGMRRSLTGRAAHGGHDRPAAAIGTPGPSGRQPSLEIW
jgi:hypothetical protein